MLRLFAVLLFALGMYAAASARAQDSITCESQDNRYRECRASGNRMRLDRTLSDAPCIEGSTWGSRNGVVWVDRGCRGRFVSDWGNGGWGGGSNSGRTVRCESNDNRTRECAAGFRGRAVLVRQLSDSRCVEGRTWGQRGSNLWVSQGCRGEFAEGRGGGWGGRPDDPGWGNANPNYTVTCSSSDNRRASCGWDRNNGRPVIVKQLSGSPCIEGRTWAYRGDQIWVDEGCRARFGAR